MATFHPFPRLPPELRAQIWEVTVMLRIVDARIISRDLIVLSDGLPRRGPASSLVNAGATFSELAALDGTGRRYIWVNFATDMISIGTTMIASYAPVAPPVQRLKLEGKTSNTINGQQVKALCNKLRDFTNVKDIHIVCTDGFGWWTGASRNNDWPCSRENLFFINPNNGSMMRSIEMDTMFDERKKDPWRWDYEFIAELRNQLSPRSSRE
ncbi:hypothetical protein F4824DRAFT_498581 [Ustulina deusta]|nr:hypothetical protein F4824DRAFT_498581 [Ustulina deusta]